MITPGKVIEYIEHGKFIVAFVTDLQASRLRLLNQHGREVNLPQARVMHTSQAGLELNNSRQATLSLLNEIAECRQAITLPLPLEEVWQLAAESTDCSFTTRFLTELCFGDAATDDHEAAFLRYIFQDTFYFKYKNGSIQAHPQEVVEQHKTRHEENLRKQRILEEGAQGLAAMMSDPSSPVDWPDKKHCLERIKEYYLFQTEAEDFETARALLKKSGLTAPHDPFKLMVQAAIWHKDENIPLLRHRIPTAFSDECASEAASLQPPSLQELTDEGRQDFRHLPLLTIDGAGTKDFDDALHIERKGDNFLVGIHITDVSRTITRHTALYQEALNRITSIYFADGVVPMLPPILSEGVFSLIKGQVRPALSFLVELSPKAEIISRKIVRSIVTVKRQLTYPEADSLASTDTDLQDLVTLSQQLRARRINAGALIIPIPDVNITITEENQISVGLLDTETTMRVLVSEFMVLANSIGAEYLALRQEPGLFRSQAPPQKRLFTEPTNDLYISFRQRRHLARGILSTTPKRHSGVGVEQYTTMTSPIRRALDLIMQSQISSILKQEGALYTTKDLNSLAADISNTGRINLVRQLRHRYWLIKHIEKQANKQFPAFILARNDKKVRVVLTDFLLEGELPPNQAFSARPGDAIMVKIAKASALDNVLKLDWG